MEDNVVLRALKRQENDNVLREIASEIVIKLCYYSINSIFSDNMPKLELTDEISKVKSYLAIGGEHEDRVILEAIIELYFKKISNTFYLDSHQE